MNDKDNNKKTKIVPKRLPGETVLFKLTDVMADKEDERTLLLP
jgi:hypothetical protein